jgi:ribonucleoside-diphosphate reductase alpha chain
MNIRRHFTKPGDPYPGINFVTRTVTRRTPSGSLKADVIVPEDWDQTAVEVMGQKYMRRAGVPSEVERVREDGVPDWLCRKVPASFASRKASLVYGGESDARTVFDRLAGCWTWWGWKLGYFGTEADALAFYEELLYMLASRRFSPNSPQWFNTGLYWGYGITAPDSGQWAVQFAHGTTPGGKVAEIEHGVGRAGESYVRPAANACFILGVKDSLLEEGGIYDALRREARIFKFGGGSGANFSALRGEGEELSGGGYSSGLMSFLDVFDAGAGGIKSGGVTRRAAKMVVTDADHPDIERFVTWKAEEEYRVAAMITGDRVIRATLRGEDADPGSEHVHPWIRRRWAEADADGFAPPFPDRPYTDHFEGKDSAYNRAGGQNSNNSVRVTNDFMARAEASDATPWELKRRTDGKTAKVITARSLWDKITRAAWLCADPGLQFHDTWNDWNLCPGDGPIRATNPCSEYGWLDDTACNLASLRLTQFAERGPAGDITSVDVEAYTHAAALATIALDITVSMAGYPSEEIADGSRKYRTIGLGYCDLGAFLMQAGYAYDSDGGRAWCAVLTSLMHSAATEQSAELARAMGTFPRYGANREHCLRVVNNHATWAFRVAGDRAAKYDGLGITPPDVDASQVPPDVLRSVEAMADTARRAVHANGLRNAQLTLIAPTGTIGLQLGCDTTGIEPDFALVKDKKLVGGGYFKIVNAGLPAALAALGYVEGQRAEIIEYVFGTRRLAGDVVEVLTAAGLKDDEIALVASNVASMNTLEDAARFALKPERWAELLDCSAAWVTARGDTFRPLASLLVRAGGGRIDAAEAVREVGEWDAIIMGTGAVEGAPHLHPGDCAVFDCATPSGTGSRSIRPEGHVLMMAAAQPALSGGISKTVNMPPESTPDDVGKVYRLSHKSMVKCCALYLDGSKLSQPLNAVRDTKADLSGVLTTRHSEPTAAPGPEPIPEWAGRDEGPVILPAYQPHEEERGAVTSKRELLPSRRGGYTQKMKLGGQSVYLRTGEYADGRLGEIFIDAADQGSAFRAMTNTVAIAVSLGLQHGVPLEEYVEAFVGLQFEPCGVLQGHPRVKMASSVIDAIFRDLAVTYLQRNELAHVQPEGPDGDQMRPPSAGLKFGAALEPAKKVWTGPPQPVEPPVTVRIDTEETRHVTTTTTTGPGPLRMGGKMCPQCGNFSVRQTGTCGRCDICFWSGGCG